MGERKLTNASQSLEDRSRNDIGFLGRQLDKSVDWVSRRRLDSLIKHF